MIDPQPIHCFICGTDLGYQVEESYPIGTPQNVFVCNDPDCLEAYIHDHGQPHGGDL